MASRSNQRIGFPLPQADTFGYCNNYKSPSFLEPMDDHKCIQRVTHLLDACNSFYNAQTLSSSLGYLSGSDSSSNANSISINSVYYYNSTSNTLTKGSNSIPFSAYGYVDSIDPVTNTSTFKTCSCANALKEAHYTMYYTPNADGTYSVNSVAADIVIDNNITLPTSYCLGVGMPDTNQYDYP